MPATSADQPAYAFQFRSLFYLQMCGPVKPGITRSWAYQVVKVEHQSLCGQPLTKALIYKATTVLKPARAHAPRPTKLAMQTPWRQEQKMHALAVRNACQPNCVTHVSGQLQPDGTFGQHHQQLQSLHVRTGRKTSDTTPRGLLRCPTSFGRFSCRKTPIQQAA